MRQDAARLKQQLVQVRVELNAPGFKGVSHRLIAPGFVDAVFLIGVQRLHAQLLA